LELFVTNKTAPTVHPSVSFYDMRKKPLDVSIVKVLPLLCQNYCSVKLNRGSTHLYTGTIYKSIHLSTYYDSTNKQHPLHTFVLAKCYKHQGTSWKSTAFGEQEYD